MSFFNQEQLANTGAFEMGGGDLAPMPKDTRVVAICEEAKNSEYEGKKFLNLKWRVSLPAEFQNRVLFQKLQVYDPDAEKANRAKNMLSAIAVNAGGKLFAAMQHSAEQAPSDASLQSITNAPMVLLLDVWEIKESGKTGNWVKAVSKYERQQQAPVAPVAPAATPFTADDVPF